MDNKAIIAIVAVVVVVAAAGAAAVTLTKSDDEKYEKVTSVGGVLQVYGNANLDSVLDEADVNYIQDVIDGSKAKNGYCDANNDGVVDEKDKQHVRDLIAYKEGTTAYYFDGNDKVATATLPIKKVVVYGSSNAQLFTLALGVANEDILVFDTWSKPVDSPDILFKKWTSAKRISVGSDMEINDVTSNGKPDAVICPNYYVTSMTDGVKDQYKKANIDIITLKSMEGKESADAELTLGFLLNKNTEAQKFAKWCEGLFNALDEKISTLDDSKKPTAFYWYGGQAVAGQGSASGNILESVGAKNLADWKEDYKVLNKDNKSWILSYHPDYILRVVSVGYASTPESQATYFHTYGDLITEMDVYQAGNFVLIDGALPQVLRLAYFAEVLHPDLFEKGFADKWHQELLDMYGFTEFKASEHNFVTYKADADKYPTA